MTSKQKVAVITGATAVLVFKWQKDLARMDIL